MVDFVVKSNEPHISGQGHVFERTNAQKRQVKRYLVITNNNNNNRNNNNDNNHHHNAVLVHSKDPKVVKTQKFDRCLIS